MRAMGGGSSRRSRASAVNSRFAEQRRRRGSRASSGPLPACPPPPAGAHPAEPQKPAAFGRSRRPRRATAHARPTLHPPRFCLPGGAPRTQRASRSAGPEPKAKDSSPARQPQLEPAHRRRQQLAKDAGAQPAATRRARGGRHEVRARQQLARECRPLSGRSRAPRRLHARAARRERRAGTGCPASGGAAGRQSAAAAAAGRRLPIAARRRRAGARCGRAAAAPARHRQLTTPLRPPRRPHPAAAGRCG